MRKIILGFCCSALLIASGVSSANTARATDVIMDGNIVEKLVFKESLGGSHYDYWFAREPLKDLGNLSLKRAGYSRTIEFPIDLDCEKSTVTVSGNGLIWDEDPLSSEDADSEMSDRVIESVLDEFCKK